MKTLLNDEKFWTDNFFREKKCWSGYQIHTCDYFESIFIRFIQNDDYFQCLFFTRLIETISRKAIFSKKSTPPFEPQSQIFQDVRRCSMSFRL